MHIIFQRHHIAPDDFLKKERWAQAFMLESMKAQIRAEQKRKDGSAADSDDPEDS